MKKSSLIIFLIGLILLVFVANNRELNSGTIQNIQSSKEKTTIQLKESEIKLVIFDEIKELEPNDKIKFIGDKGAYNGRTQIVIQEIYTIKDDR